MTQDGQAETMRICPGILLTFLGKGHSPSIDWLAKWIEWLAYANDGWHMCPCFGRVCLRMKPIDRGTEMRDVMGKGYSQ